MRWVGLAPGLVPLTDGEQRAGHPAVAAGEHTAVDHVGRATRLRRVRGGHRADPVLPAPRPLALLVVGFALLLWPFTGGSFAGALRLAGSSVFTPRLRRARHGTATVLANFAAAAGLVVVALQIAYLPPCTPRSTAARPWSPCWKPWPATPPRDHRASPATWSSTASTSSEDPWLHPASISPCSAATTRGAFACRPTRTSQTPLTTAGT